MEVSALIISKDLAALGVLRRAMLSVGIVAETCGGVSAAMKVMGARKFDGIVVDCDDLDGGSELLKSLRSQPVAKSVIIFAMVHGTTSMSQVFHMGANFVMEKPLAFDRIVRCLRAAHGLMIGERRRYYRYPVEIPIRLDLGGGASNVSAASVDLSSGGLAIKTRQELAAGKRGTVNFTLPGSNNPVEGQCDVVWTGEGRAGIRFLKLSNQSKTALDTWLSERFDYTRGQDGGRPSQFATIG